MNVNASNEAESRAGGVYSSRQSRHEQATLIAEVRRGLHPLVTFRDEPLLRWVPEDWYHDAVHAIDVLASLDTLGALLQWGDESEVRQIGAALKKLAALPAAQPAEVRAAS